LGCDRQPGVVRNGTYPASSALFHSHLGTENPRLSADNFGTVPKVVPLGEYGSAQGRGMQALEVPRAVAATVSTASSLGLTVDDVIVLHDSNRLTVRLLPCDVLARVAPVAHQVAQFEVELAQRLTEYGCPVAALEPRVEPHVYERDGFVVTLWTYYEPVTSREVSPADYANALARLHAGMRKLDVATPHFTDRVDSAQQLVASRDRTPALTDADRELLGDTLRGLRRVIGERGGEQLLHGEPHPGNVLTTKNGLLFIDLETCCRGPVEFDLAHAPEEVSEHYPGVNQDLLRECRILVLAMITTWRWDVADQFPNGRQLGTEWLSQIRAALERNGLETYR
jgi:thiamine kinase-like enzyme